MDKQYSREFFSNFVSALQDVCRVYLDFNESVDVSGYLAVELDGRQRERFVLSELINASGTGVSESYCIKAFKTMQPMAHSSSELMIGVKRRRKDSRQLDMVIPQQSPCPSTSGSDCGVRGYRSSLEGASDNAVSGSHSRDSSPVQNLLKALRHHSTNRGSEVGLGQDYSLATDKENLTDSKSRECSREVCQLGRETNKKSLTIPHHTCQCCQLGNNPVSFQHPMEAQEDLHSHESVSTKRNKPRSGISLDISKDQSKQSEQKPALECSHSPDSYREHRTLSDQNLTKSSGVSNDNSEIHKTESEIKDTENTAVKEGRSCSIKSHCSSGVNSSETPQSPIPYVSTASNTRSAKEDKAIASDIAYKPVEEHSELTTCRNSDSHCGAGSKSIIKSVNTDKCGRNTAAPKMGVMPYSQKNPKSNKGDEASPAKSNSLKRHLASDSGLDSQPTVSLCRRRHLEFGDGEVNPKTDSHDQPCQEGDPGCESEGELRMEDDHNAGSPVCKSVKKDPDKYQKLTQKTNGKVKKSKSTKMTCSDLLKCLVKPIESSQRQAKDCSKQGQSEELSRYGTKSTQSEEPISCGRKSKDSKEQNSRGTKNTGSVASEQYVYIPSKTLKLNDDIDDIVIKEELSDIKSESDSQRLVIDMGVEEQDIEGDDDEEDTNDLYVETDSELDAIDRNVRTAQKTRYHLNLLTSHLLTWSETRPVEDIPCNKLDTFLSTFFATVRKETGDDYEPMSLSSIQSSIDRHLRKARYPYSIKKDRQFAHSRSVLEARQRLLGSHVEKKQRSPAQITEREITRLYSTGQLGMETPHALLNTAWFLNNIHFGLSSSMEHYYLKWGDISLETDADGREWLLMTRRKPGGEESVVRVSASEGDPARCCVSVFKKYMSVRPPEMCKPDSPFYLTVNLHRRESQYWYRAQTMGYNKFGSNLRKMAAAAGLNSKKFSSTAVQLAPET